MLIMMTVMVLQLCCISLVFLVTTTSVQALDDYDEDLPLDPTKPVRDPEITKATIGFDTKSDLDEYIKNMNKDKNDPFEPPSDEEMQALRRDELRIRLQLQEFIEEHGGQGIQSMLIFISKGIMKFDEI